MSNFENNKADTFGDNTTQQPAGSGFGATELGRSPSDNRDTQKLGNTGTFGSSDEYDTQKLGNTGMSGQDSLSSGALDETHPSFTSSGLETGREESGLTANDPYGSAKNGADPALSTTAVAGDDDAPTGRANDSGFDDTAGFGGMQAGGGISGTNAGYGTQAGGGGGAGFTGGKVDNDFLDTAAASSGGTGRAHTGVGNNNNTSSVGSHEAGGDSKVGKLMQKTGEMLGNAKLEQKGQLKREEKGADVVSSATAGGKQY